MTTMAKSITAIMNPIITKIAITSLNVSYGVAGASLVPFLFKIFIN